MSDDEDDGGREPSKFPHMKRNAAIILVIVLGVYAAYSIIGSELSTGLLYPKNVGVSGTANLPAIDLIPQDVYFTNQAGHVFTAPVSTSALYSITLTNQVSYNVSIQYKNVVGGLSDTCNAGILNLESHSNSTSFNPSCSTA